MHPVRRPDIGRPSGWEYGCRGLLCDRRAVKTYLDTDDDDIAISYDIIII
jgi:hypothetical protein